MPDFINKIEEDNRPKIETPKEERQLETIQSPEVEKLLEKTQPEIREVKPPPSEIPKTTPPLSHPSKPSLSPPKDPVLIQVEHILEEDLKDIYLELPPKIQEKFRQKGDEIAKKIWTMIIELKAKAKKILDLIRSWLRLIPGVNKYFLEQEAKIKTDKLMILAEYEKEKRYKS
jgi:hypothetical protein